MRQHVDRLLVGAMAIRAMLKAGRPVGRAPGNLAIPILDSGGDPAAPIDGAQPVHAGSAISTTDCWRPWAVILEY